MHALDRSTRRAGLPLGGLGALLLVATVEAWVAGRSADLTRQDNWEWRLTGRSARRAPSESDVLAFGSSLVKLGVIPRVLERATGRRAYNLGLCAGSPPTSYFLLRRALESGARPGAVVVEFHPLSLTRGPWHTVGFWPDLVDTREALDLAVSARDPGFFAAVTLARLLPTLKDRHGVRAAVSAALRGASASQRLGVLALARNVAKNRGALPVPPAPREGPPRLPADDVAMPRGAWAPSRFAETFVDRFLDLAGRNGARVVWVLPPVTPALRAVREANGTDPASRAFARRVAGQHPGVTVVDGTGLPLDPAWFLDAEHLDRRGAARWSAAVASALRLNPGARWVRAEVPPAGAADGDVVEDFGESVRAVQALAAGTSRLR